MTSLRITQAEPTPENLRTILGLTEEAVDWLRDKGTSQWAKPWPDESRRDLRIVKGLQVRSAREPGPGPDLMLPRAPAPARDAG
jgi:hypothetical protein